MKCSYFPYVHSSKDELATYVSMIGEDDWCVNYDKEKRMCGIYETRPGFCVVDPRKFKTMFGVEQEDLNVSERDYIFDHLYLDLLILPL